MLDVDTMPVCIFHRYYTHVAQAEARKKALEAAAVDSKSAAKFVAGRVDADDEDA